jgi:hypothetical protein
MVEWKSSGEGNMELLFNECRVSELLSKSVQKMDDGDKHTTVAFTKQHQAVR